MSKMVTIYNRRPSIVHGATVDGKRTQFPPGESSHDAEVWKANLANHTVAAWARTGMLIDMSKAQVMPTPVQRVRREEPTKEAREQVKRDLLGVDVSGAAHAIGKEAAPTTLRAWLVAEMNAPAQRPMLINMLRAKLGIGEDEAKALANAPLTEPAPSPFDGLDSEDEDED
jgi:predicted metal-binding membrane protein